MRVKWSSATSGTSSRVRATQPDSHSAWANGKPSVCLPVCRWARPRAGSKSVVQRLPGQDAALATTAPAVPAGPAGAAQFRGPCSPSASGASSLRHHEGRMASACRWAEPGQSPDRRCDRRTAICEGEPEIGVQMTRSGGGRQRVFRSSQVRKRQPAGGLRSAAARRRWLQSRARCAGASSRRPLVPHQRAASSKPAASSGRSVPSLCRSAAGARTRPARARAACRRPARLRRSRLSSSWFGQCGIAFDEGGQRRQVDLIERGVVVEEPFEQLGQLLGRAAVSGQAGIAGTDGARASRMMAARASRSSSAREPSSTESRAMPMASRNSRSFGSTGAACAPWSCMPIEAVAQIIRRLVRRPISSHCPINAFRDGRDVAEFGRFRIIPHVKEWERAQTPL